MQLRGSWFGHEATLYFSCVCAQLKHYGRSALEQLTDTYILTEKYKTFRCITVSDIQIRARLQIYQNIGPYLLIANILYRYQRILQLENAQIFL